MPPTVVSVRGLTKAFTERRGWTEMARHPFRKAGRTTVVDDVSFSVNASEFFGLLGANGAGKTTLFRMLGTQLLPDSGTATIAGCDIVREPAAVRRLLTPVVADERSLNWRLSARENLELFAALYAIPPASTHARISELLEVVELTDAGERMVGTFSSGMKQRLLIARALLPRPRVLLLDEPTRSLDPISARRFRQFLREEIAGRQQCTVLLATHSPEEAFDLCDRVAVLDRGRILAVGPVDELAAEVRGDSYILTIRDAHVQPAQDVILAAGLDIPVMRDEPAPGSDEQEAGWRMMEIRLAGGPSAAAELVGRLSAAAVHIASLERRALTLADLLEGIVTLRRGTS